MSSRSYSQGGGGAAQQKQITQQEVRVFLNNPNEPDNWKPFESYIIGDNFNVRMNEKMMRSLYKVLKKNPALIDKLIVFDPIEEERSIKSRIISGARFNVCFFDDPQLSDILIRELLQSNYDNKALSLLTLMKEYGVKSLLLDDAIRQRQEIENGVITTEDVGNFLKNPANPDFIQKLAKFIHPVTGDQTFLGIKMYEPLHTVLTQNPELVDIILKALMNKNNKSNIYKIMETMMHILIQYSLDDTEDSIQYLRKVVSHVSAKLEQVKDTRNSVYIFLNTTLNQRNTDDLLQKALTAPLLKQIRDKLREIRQQKSRTRVIQSLSALNPRQHMKSSRQAMRAGGGGGVAIPPSLGGGAQSIAHITQSPRSSSRQRHVSSASSVSSVSDRGAQQIAQPITPNPRSTRQRTPQPRASTLSLDLMPLSHQLISLLQQRGRLKNERTITKTINKSSTTTG